MELTLINQEISESILYRSNRSFSLLNGRDIADLLYLHTIMTYMLIQDTSQARYGLEYAEDTSKYGGYSMFRTSATDLYMLAYQATNPDNKHVRLADAHDSKKFLSNLMFVPKKHWQFIRNISKDNLSKNQVTLYLYSLESQLKIKDARYKTWRRAIVDWDHQVDSRHRSIAANLRREIKRLARNGDLITPLTALAGYEPAKDKYVPLDKSSSGDKIMGAAIGALAGRYVAAKIADRTGGDKDKMKTIGTGLGAIAGYWNAGRQRKQS